MTTPAADRFSLHYPENLCKQGLQTRIHQFRMWSSHGAKVMTAYRILGTNDEVTTCECCGRNGLKKTVVLTDSEREVRFGTECAARAMKVAKRDVEAGVKTATADAARARREQINREEEVYGEWLMKTYGDNRSTLERRRAWRAAA
jgi:hypothetical protein